MAALARKTYASSKKWANEVLSCSKTLQYPRISAFNPLLLLAKMDYRGSTGKIQVAIKPNEAKVEV